MCSTPAPVAAATTAPPEEPPGVIFGFQGLRVTPVKGLSVIAFQPNSGVVVSPIKTAPAARSRFTDGASCVHGVVDVVRLPYLTARPLTHRISLMVVGTPSILDKGAPLRHRAVDSFAIAKAASTSMSEKALNCSCTCSARASVACATSRGVNFPELKPAVSSPTSNRHSSFASVRNRLFIIIRNQTSQQ
jgi:hypothetical protein